MFCLHMYMFSIYGAKYSGLRLKVNKFDLILITLLFFFILYSNQKVYN